MRYAVCLPELREDDMSVSTESAWHVSSAPAVAALSRLCDSVLSPGAARLGPPPASLGHSCYLSLMYDALA